MDSKIFKTKAYFILKGISVAAAIFSLFVGMLIIITYIQIDNTDPLNSPVYLSLIDRYRKNTTDNELKNEIRAFDLLRRKAYFTSKEQIHTGGNLLAGGIIITLLGYAFVGRIKKKIPRPNVISDTDKIAFTQSLGRWLIIGFFTLFGVLSLVIAFFTADVLNKPLGELLLEKDKIADKYYNKSEYSNNWPSFRGAGGYGIASSGDYPVKWDGRKGEGVLWKTVIPRKGFNSPIIWDKKIFLSGGDKEAFEVFCFSTGSGELLWRKAVKDLSEASLVLPDVSGDTGYAAPTMATDGYRVYALFASGDLFCLDFSGQILWSKTLGVPKNIYGQSSSLIIYRNLLIVQYDQEEDAKLLALDTENGRISWQVKREVITSWASPIIVDEGEKQMVILNANPIVAAYNPANGEQLFSVDCMMGEVAPSPAYSAGFVFAANQYASLVCINPDTKEVVWEFYDDLPNVSSPLAMEKYVFLATSYGVIVCLDAKKGDVLWTKEFEYGFYSSPILVGNKVYLLDRKGKMYIFNASNEFILVGSPELGEDTVSTPAFYNNRIYIRGSKHLYCIGDNNG